MPRRRRAIMFWTVGSIGGLPVRRRGLAPIQMKNFSQRIADAARLSITFRFKSGSTELDNRSLEDVGRLASYVKSKPGLADRIMLFGFADTMGNPQDNLALSRERAVQVADALGAQGVSMQPAQIQGFGIIAPSPATLRSRSRKEPPSGSVAAPLIQAPSRAASRNLASSGQADDCSQDRVVAYQFRALCPHYRRLVRKIQEAAFGGGRRRGAHSGKRLFPAERYFGEIPAGNIGVPIRGGEALGRGIQTVSIGGAP